MTKFHLPKHLPSRLPIMESRSSKKAADLPSSLTTSLSPIASAVKASVAGLVGLSLAHGGAQAATIRVTSNSDVSANDTVCTLREAITAINDAPNLPLSNGCVVAGSFDNNDTVTFSQNLPNNTIVLNQGQLEITENTDITINASNITDGITVDANYASRGFNVGENASVSIDSFTIMNGFVDDSGGGILVDSGSSITLTDSTVTGNETGPNGVGGGIATSSSLVTLIDSAVSGNVSPNLGGGISARSFSTISLVNSTVSGNEVNYSGGGGIHASFSDIILDDSSVSGNTANYGGGIVVRNGSSVELTNSTVSENTAGINGGGIFASDEAIVNVVDSNLLNNQTTGQADENSNGGAIFATGNTRLDLTRTTLDGNSAFDDGGGIYIDYSYIRVVRSTLSNNRALGRGSAGEEMDGDGGAAFVRSESSQNIEITIIASTLSGNYASGDGGALYIGELGTFLSEHSTISNNTALGNGGGVAITSDSNLFIANSIIANSTSNINMNVDCFAPTNTFTFIDGTSIIESGGCGSGRSTDPRLEPLADNGGTTQTHALRVDSPARDVVPQFTCTRFGGFDQLMRIRDDGNGLCDVGAVEYFPLPNESGFYVIPLGNGKSVVVPL